MRTKVAVTLEGGKDASWGRTHIGRCYCPGGICTSKMCLLEELSGCFAAGACAPSCFTNSSPGMWTCCLTEEMIIPQHLPFVSLLCGWMLWYCADFCTFPTAFCFAVKSVTWEWWRWKAVQSHRDHHMVAFLLLRSAAQWVHPHEQQLSPLAAEEQVRASVTFPGWCLSDGPG